MIAHFSKNVAASDLVLRKQWDDIKADLRRIYNLNGQQEILAVESDEDGLHLYVKTHPKEDKDIKTDKIH